MRLIRTEPVHEESSLSEMSFDIETSNRTENQNVPESVGRGHTRIINIGNRIRLINRDIIAREATVVHYQNKLPEQTTVGAFSLYGDSLSDLNDIRQRLHHCQGSYHWGHVPQEDCSSVFPGGKRASMLFISVSHDLLTQCPESMESGAISSLWQIMAGKEGGVCAPRMFSPEVLVSLRGLVNQPVVNPWDWLVVESRILGIIANCLFLHDRDSSESTDIPLHQEDREKLLHARDLLVGWKGEPPAIAELAKTVGMNDFKLKKGFKQLFGTTMFACLRARRLDRAFTLIGAGEMNVAEAACEVGYANSSAFSAAFRKAYGFNPSECRKRYFQVPGGYGVGSSLDSRYT